MSNKKNTPISIYGKNKQIKKVISYTVNNEKYKETIDLDTANGNFGRSLKIEKKVTSFKDLNININPLGIPSTSFELVTNKEELSTIQDDTDRITEYSNFLQKISKEDGATDALDASGMKDIAEGGLAVGHNIPLPGVKSTATVKGDGDTKTEPQDIDEGYKKLFNEPLIYPIDMSVGDNGISQDYMYFEQFLYKAPQAGSITVDKDKLGDVIKRGIGRKTNLGELKGTCKLPIPNKLGVSQGVNWGEGRANSVELGAFQAANASVRDALKGESLGEVFTRLFRGGGKQVGSTFNQLKEDIRNADGTANAGAVVNAVLARSLLGRIGINVDVDQFITRETGSAINPNLELLFGGPQLRTFSFVFNFAPNSAKEARMVRLIQRWFREGMLPQKTSNFGGGGLFLGSPNVFRLCYKNNKRRIKGLNTFKICAVTSVQVDFTPDGVYQSYQDGEAVSQPVRSTMSVTFNELTPIFANDYQPDFENDPSLEDIKDNIDGKNAITEDDLGF